MRKAFLILLCDRPRLIILEGFGRFNQGPPWSLPVMRLFPLPRGLLRSTSPPEFFFWCTGGGVTKRWTTSPPARSNRPLSYLFFSPFSLVCPPPPSHKERSVGKSGVCSPFRDCKGPFFPCGKPSLSPPVPPPRLFFPPPTHFGNVRFLWNFYLPDFRLGNFFFPPNPLVWFIAHTALPITPMVRPSSRLLRPFPPTSPPSTSTLTVRHGTFLSTPFSAHPPGCVTPSGLRTFLSTCRSVSLLARYPGPTRHL